MSLGVPSHCLQSTSAVVSLVLENLCAAGEGEQAVTQLVVDVPAQTRAVSSPEVFAQEFPFGTFMSQSARVELARFHAGCLVVPDQRSWSSAQIAFDVPAARTLVMFAHVLKEGALCVVAQSHTGSTC